MAEWAVNIIPYRCRFLFLRDKVVRNLCFEDSERNNVAYRRHGDVWRWGTDWVMISWLVVFSELFSFPFGPYLFQYHIEEPKVSISHRSPLLKGYPSAREDPTNDGVHSIMQELNIFGSQVREENERVVETQNTLPCDDHSLQPFLLREEHHQANSTKSFVQISLSIIITRGIILQ